MIKKLCVAGSIIGAVLVALLICAAIMADSLAGNDPLKQDFESVLSPPDKQHSFGTDRFGRDVKARVVYGLKEDLAVGAQAVVASLVIGGILGVLAGAIGGVADQVIVFFGRFLAAGPAILFAVVLALRGLSFADSTIYLSLGISVILLPGFIRTVRGITLAASDISASKIRRVLSITGIIAARLSISMTLAVLVYTGFSFIGLGAQPPLPELGLMLSDARNLLGGDYAHLYIYPGLTLIFTALSFSILGESLGSLLQQPAKNL
jgi:ABC-type dipeptide/oligopeptide/nickel transport system permease subunit